jgi:hypothetical protein
MDSLPSWARVGQKVVATIRFEAGVYAKPIEKGCILTIRKVFFGRKAVGLLFLEIVNEKVWTFEGEMERSYDISGFKPLISKSIEDDIAIFAPLLNTKKMEELAQ